MDMIKASDWMTKNVVTVPTGSSLVQASQLMVEKGISSIVVVGKTKYVGIITEKDFVTKIISQNVEYKDLKVDDIMTNNPITVSLDKSISEIMLLFKEKRIKRVLVTDNDKLVGILSMTDYINNLT